MPVFAMVCLLAAPLLGQTQFNNPPASSSGGDVTGPVGATENAVPVFSGTTGKALGSSFATLPAGNGELVFRNQMVQIQCMQVAKVNAANLLFFRTAMPLTVGSASCLIADGTSVDVTFNECDSSGANCVAIESLSCVTSGSISTAIDHPVIAQGVWIRANVGEPSGVINQLALCVSYIPGAPGEE